MTEVLNSVNFTSGEKIHAAVLINFIVNQKKCQNQIFLSFQVFQNWTFSVSAKNLLNKFPNLTVMSQLIPTVSVTPRVTHGNSLKAVQPLVTMAKRILGSQAKFGYPFLSYHFFFAFSFTILS